MEAERRGWQFVYKRLVSRKRLLRAGCCCLLVFVCLVIARNPIAKLGAQWIGSQLLENRLTIGRIWIGWHNIEITDVKICDCDDAAASLLTVKSIAVQPSLLQGLCRGVWLRSLVIKQPEVTLRFAADGRLLTHFPAFESPPPEPRDEPLVIPIELLTVEEAALTIDQVGRTPLKISGVRVAFRADERLRFTLDIDQLFDSKLHLNSQLDAQTYAGQTSLELEPLVLDCQQLANLPLVPPPLGEVLITAQIRAQALVKHPPNEADWRQHDAAFGLAVDQIDNHDSTATTNQPMPDSLEEIYSNFLAARIGNQLAMRVRMVEGRLDVTAGGPLSGGQIYVDIHSDLLGPVPAGTCHAAVADVDVGQIVRAVRPDLAIPVEMVANVRGNGTASFDDGQLAWKAKITPVLSKIEVQGIECSDVMTEIQSEGDYRPGGGQVGGHLSARIHSEGVQLSQLAARAGIPNLAGVISAAASVEVPLSDLGDVDSIKASAQLTSSPIHVDGFICQPLSGVASVRTGRVSVELPQWAISVIGDRERPTGSIASRAQLASGSMIALAARAHADLQRIQQPEAWQAEVSVQGESIALAGERVEDFTIGAELASGQLEIPTSLLRWRSTECRLNGVGNLVDEQTVSVRFEVGPFQLNDIAAAASRFSSQPMHLAGTGRTDGIATFSIADGTFLASGGLTVSAAKWQAVEVGGMQLAWQADPSKFQLQSQSDQLLGGAYAATATLESFDWTQTKVALQWNGIQLPRLAQLVNAEIPISGAVGGAVEISSIAKFPEIDATGRVSLSGTRLLGLPIAFATKKLEIRAGDLSLQAQGQMLDGDLALTATTHLPSLIDWQQQGGDLTLLPVSVQAIASGLQVQRAAIAVARERNLSGECQLRLVRDSTMADKGLLCNAECSLANVRYRHHPIADRLTGTAYVRADRVELRQVSGKIAGGRLTGDADIGLRSPLSGRYTLALQRAKLRSALAPVGAATRSISGLASLSATGRIGNLTTATVKTQLSNIYANDLMVREARLPMTCDYQLATGRARWTCRGGSVHVGGGLVQLDCEGNLSRGLASMNADVQLRNVDTTQLLRGKKISAGIINGYAILRAERADAPEDLVGKFRIELSKIKGLELPGFDQLQRLTRVPQLSTPQLSAQDLGIINGRIGGGLIYLDDATVSQSGLLVLADGSSTMGGIIDLNVTAVTNPTGPASGLLELANSPLMLAAPAPVALLAKANDALKDRVFHIHVNGTAARPVLHIQPGKGLSQNALRFVLSSTVGSQVTDAAMGKTDNTQR